MVGVCDPTTCSTSGEYWKADVSGESGVNGHFNRIYVVASKHFETTAGVLGFHLGYLYNNRLDYKLNGPCVGITWAVNEFWPETNWLDSLKLIAEYDARTINIGLITSSFNNYFDFCLELQNFRWLSYGLRFKHTLLG